MSALNNCLGELEILQKHPYSEQILKLFKLSINSMIFVKNVVVKLMDANVLYPFFFVLKEMYKVENQIYLYTDVLETLCFNDSLNAFEVCETEINRLININELQNYHPVSIWYTSENTTMYISCKDNLCI